MLFSNDRKQVVPAPCRSSFYEISQEELHGASEAFAGLGSRDGRRPGKGALLTLRGRSKSERIALSFAGQDLRPNALFA